MSQNPTTRTLHSDLGYVENDTPLTLHVGAASYPLSRHTDASRTDARASNAALRLVADERLSHQALDVVAPEYTPVLMMISPTPSSAARYSPRSISPARACRARCPSSPRPRPIAPTSPAPPSTAPHSAPSGRTCILRGTVFNGLAHDADLTGLQARYCTTDHDFSGGVLVDADFGDADVSDARFVGTTLTGIDFSRATLDRADFTGDDIRGISFQGLHMASTIFAQTMGTGVDSSRGNLSSADLSGAVLDNTSFASITAEGANFANAALTSASFQDASLGTA